VQGLGFAEEAGRFLADLTRAWGGPPPERPGACLGLAVSGGPDSMAMLALAADALPGRVAAATVDHGLRAEGAGEAAAVAAACERLGVRHTTLPLDGLAAGPGVQARARAARYAALAGWAADGGLAAVATAHHADDQAETFLMRAGRAAGLAGLAGARPLSVIGGLTVVRPLLEWRRAELRALVRRRELPFVDDPSNDDARFERTRVRRLLHENEWLAPANLARSAAWLAEADADLTAAVDWLWRTRALVGVGAGADGDDVVLEAADLPRELRRRLARRAVAAARAGAGAGIERPAFDESANVEPLLDALERGRRATQGGVLASVRAGRWHFRPAPPRKGE